MRLQLPPNLHYPITIHKLLKQPKDRVNRLDGLFTYYSLCRRPVQDKYESEVERWETMKVFGTFDSSVDGEMVRWRIKEGTVIEKAGLVMLAGQ